MKLFAMDVSGGMSISVLQKVINDIEKRGNPLDIVCFFDTRVLEEIFVGALSDKRLPAGGGTEIQPVIDWAASHACGQNEVIIYTDGFINTHAPTVPSDLKAQMVLVGEQAMTRDMARRCFPDIPVIGDL